MARKGNTIPELDIGKQVRKVMFEKGMNKARLARSTHRTGEAIKQVIYRSSIQTYLVWELSVALGHNFFADLARQLDAATENNLSGAEGSELDQLKREHEKLKEDYAYLKKAIDLLSKQ